MGLGEKPPANPPSLETVWSSRDHVEQASLPFLQEAGHRLVADGLVDDDGLIGIRSARGLLTTRQGAQLSRLETSDLVMVVDVDPVKGIMVVYGPGEPSAWAGLLASVMRHRHEVGAAILTRHRHRSISDGKGALVGPTSPTIMSQSEQQGRQSRESQALKGTGLGPQEGQGWGFEEGGIDPDMAIPSGLVDWTAFVLKQMRGRPVVALPGGDRLIVGETLDQTMEKLAHQESQNE